ncbi:MAG TPA: ferritin [Vicinamibacterales bacterium]|nr:ferritin [Vicinamibacterales bacterium]
MLISQELTAAFNEEIGRELFASNQYTNIACYFESMALRKLAALFHKQADEERMHALKFVKYLNDVGASVALPAIQAPQPTFKSVEEAVQKALDWEREVTRQVNSLMSMAIDQKDYAAQDFLRWFVTEQVEEEATMTNLLQVVRAAGDRNLLVVEAYLVHQD